MDFDLTEEQQMLKDATRDYAKERLAPLAKEADEQEMIPPEVLKELAQLGYCGIGTPEAYGGAAMDGVCYVLIISELS